MRKYMFSLVSASAVVLAAGAANDPFSKSQGVIDVAVFGDSPYGTDAPFGGTTTDTSQLQATPTFIDSINAADPQFVVHVGDIHSGKQNCTIAYDQKIYDLWTAFERPLVYTPGDNEWSDCHKVGEGGGVFTGGSYRVRQGRQRQSHRLRRRRPDREPRSRAFDLLLGSRPRARRRP